MNDFIDILILKLAIWVIRKGWGGDCLEYAEGCAECEAGKVIDWLQNAIKLIKS
jgi:hypothetical protein